MYCMNWGIYVCKVLKPVLCTVLKYMCEVVKSVQGYCVLLSSMYTG